MKIPLLVLLLLLTARPAGAAEPPGMLPLPEAPIVLVIPDAAAFDRALAGGFRKALEGNLPATDPVAAALRRTRVGGKLEEQWALFSRDLPLTWNELMALKPTALGLSLLSAGDLEAVLALRTPLAELPLALPKGVEKAHRGAPYRVVSRGAGDERTAARRLGLAWARTGGVLLLASSERALLLALDRALAGEGVAPFLPGLASLKLDVSALRRDLYFRREFLFEEGTAGKETGTVRCALRLEGSRLVEVREGEGESRGAAPAWETEGRNVSAAGWETDENRFFSALRRGFLEPVPHPPEHPVPAQKPLPSAGESATDPYAVDLRRPETGDGATDGDGELPRWAEHLKSPALEGWGWEIGASGARRVVVRRPAALDAAFVELSLATVTRRAGRSDSTRAGELRVGPDLPALAWKRTGAWLWIAVRPEDLLDVPEPREESGLVRWSRLDLSGIRREAKAWPGAEGTFSPGRTRPFSDRVLGLLGWAPRTSSLRTERRREGNRWTERIAFAAASPEAKSAPR